MGAKAPDTSLEAVSHLISSPTTLIPPSHRARTLPSLPWLHKAKSSRCREGIPAGRPHLQGCAQVPSASGTFGVPQTNPPAVSVTHSWHLSRALMNISALSLHWQKHSSKLSQSKCILHSFRVRTDIHTLGLILLSLTKKVKISIQLSFTWPSNSPALAE